MDTHKSIRVTRMSALLTNLSDSVLVTLSKRGNLHAFSRLYRKYLDSVYRYAYYRSNRDAQAAEDIVQTSFTKVWEKIGSYKSVSGSFRGWLFSVVHNTMVDFHRAENRTTRMSEDLPGDDGPESEAEGLFVAQALETLPEAQREIVVLRFIEGYPVRETARITGRTEEAVRSMQYRALQVLRKELQYE